MTERGGKEKQNHKQYIMEQQATIISFTYPHEAHVARAFLESEGIPVSLKDELTVQVNNFYSNSVGGVKLQVSESDKDRSIRLLTEAGYILKPEENGDERPHKPERLSPANPLACPYCHSTDIRKQRKPGYFIVFSILLLGFPLLFFRSAWFCFDCKREWKWR